MTANPGHSQTRRSRSDTQQFRQRDATRTRHSGSWRQSATNWNAPYLRCVSSSWQPYPDINATCHRTRAFIVRIERIRGARAARSLVSVLCEGMAFLPASPFCGDAHICVALPTGGTRPRRTARSILSKDSATSAAIFLVMLPILALATRQIFRAVLVLTVGTGVATGQAGTAGTETTSNTCTSRRTSKGGRKAAIDKTQARLCVHAPQSSHSPPTHVLKQIFWQRSLGETILWMSACGQRPQNTMRCFPQTRRFPEETSGILMLLC